MYNYDVYQYVLKNNRDALHTSSLPLRLVTIRD